MILADRHRVAANLRAARQAAGLNATEFGALFGVTRCAVHTWERGQKVFRPETLQLIADRLGVPVETLTGGPKRGAR